jgi:hypothetical protein
MNRTITATIAAGAMLGATLALAGCNKGDTPKGTHAMEDGPPVKHGTTTVPSYAGTKLAATLDGKAEVPGPGDAAATGEATVWVDAGKNKVCYLLGVAGLDAPTMAHIHKGAAGVAGDAVVDLQDPATMKSQGCAGVSHDLAEDIADHPANYYVNVHNAAHPAGAIRGQLQKPA